MRKEKNRKREGQGRKGEVPMEKRALLVQFIIRNCSSSLSQQNLGIPDSHFHLRERLEKTKENIEERWGGREGGRGEGTK